MLDITKSEIDAEFSIAERYETKARTFFGFAVVLFGVTQAYVLRGHFEKLSAARHDHLVLAIIVAGGAFLLAMLGVMFATLQRSDANFKDTRLFSFARDQGTELSAVVQEYIAMLVVRRETNNKRLKSLRVAQITAFVATLATAFEFVLAAIYFI